jgi:hypothetical protein
VADQRNLSALTLREVRRLAELTLNQGDGEWLPYEETWYEIATGLIRAVDALEYIGHFASDQAAMKTARTLHYDMAGKANEALFGLLQSKMPPRDSDATGALHE